MHALVLFHGSLDAQFFVKFGLPDGGVLSSLYLSPRVLIVFEVQPVTAHFSLDTCLTLNLDWGRFLDRSLTLLLTAATSKDSAKGPKGIGDVTSG